jgi:hypothetical protein
MIFLISFEARFYKAGESFPWGLDL